MEDFCLYQHLGCTEREVYRGERWGNWESERVSVYVSMGKREVGVANREWSRV